MKTTTAKPRPRPVPSAELLIRPDGDAPAAALLSAGRLADAYLITPVAEEPSAARGVFGRTYRTYRVEKIADGTVYEVRLNGEQSSCQCKGFTYTGHCKHVTGLAALVAAGQL